jgi:hypothetical protein
MAERTPAAVVAFSKSTHSGLLRYLGIFDVIDTVVNMMKPRGLPLNFTLSHILKQVSFLYCGAVQCELGERSRIHWMDKAAIAVFVRHWYLLQQRLEKPSDDLHFD